MKRPEPEDNCMPVATIDTHEIVKELTAVGFTEGQAEVCIGAEKFPDPKGYTPDFPVDDRRPAS
jgi:hypothetical protein